MQNKVLPLRINQISPYIRAAGINTLAPGFDTGYRKIYHYQLQYIQKGHGEIEIEGTHYKASKEDLFMWGPGEEHWIYSSTNTP